MDPSDTPAKEPHLPPMGRIGDLIAPRRRKTSLPPGWKTEP